MVGAVIMFFCGMVIGNLIWCGIYWLPREGKNWFCVTCCNHEMGWTDIFPWKKYIINKGKCPYCGYRLFSRQIMVEWSYGLVCLWMYLQFGQTIRFFEACFFMMFLIIVTVIDYEHALILDSVVAAMATVGIVFLIISNEGMWKERFLAAAVGGGFLLLVALVSRGGMGGGDIKFMAASGIWLGIELTILSLCFSFIFGGIVGAALLAGKVKKHNEYIPFGPFLCIGNFISMFFGKTIINWYLSGW